MEARVVLTCRPSAASRKFAAYIRGTQQKCLERRGFPSQTYGVLDELRTPRGGVGCLWLPLAHLRLPSVQPATNYNEATSSAISDWHRSTISRRSLAPTFRRMRWIWFLTVCSERLKRLPISLLESPRRIKPTSCCSLRVNPNLVVWGGLKVKETSRAAH